MLALYRLAVRPATRIRAAMTAILPVYTVGIVYLLRPVPTVGDLLSAALLGFGLAIGMIAWLWLVQERRVAQSLRRRMRQQGEDVPQRIVVHSAPDGFRWRHDHARLAFAWSAMQVRRQRGWWVLRLQGREVFRLPDRRPVAELLSPPVDPAPLPPMPSGTQTWSLGPAEHDALRIFAQTRRRSIPRRWLWPLVVLLGGAAAAWALVVDPVQPAVAAFGIAMALFALLIRFLSRRVRWLAKNGTELGVCFTESGITSCQPGVQRFTPWSATRDWQETTTHLGLRLRGNLWLVMPKSVVPDLEQARAWFDAAPKQPVPRASLQGDVGPRARDNPFAPPAPETSRRTPRE